MSPRRRAVRAGPARQPLLPDFRDKRQRHVDASRHSRRGSDDSVFGEALLTTVTSPNARNRSNDAQWVVAFFPEGEPEPCFTCAPFPTGLQNRALPRRERQHTQVPAAGLFRF